MAATNRYMNVGPVTWATQTGVTGTPSVTATTMSGIRSANLNYGLESLLESADFDLYHTVGGITLGSPSITLRTIDAFGIYATTVNQFGQLVVTCRDFYNGATASGGGKTATLSSAFIGSRGNDFEYRQLGVENLTFMAVSTDGATSPLAIAAL